MKSMRVSDLLGQGQAAAVPLRHLVALTGLEGRTVRKMIERERRHGIPILSDCRRGYYLPVEDAEVWACVGSLRRRAHEILRTAAALEKTTPGEDDGQFMLWDGGGRCG